MIDFSLTSEQQLAQTTARDFATRVLLPKAKARDEHDTFPDEEIAALGGLGLLGVNVDEALSGSGLGVVAYSVVITELARADASVTVAVAVTNMVAEVVAQFASDETKRALVPPLVEGRIGPGAFALSEAQAGSDPQGMTTTATRLPDGTWHLVGNKQWITSGDRAGVFVIWARTPEGGPRSISAFAVRGGNPGIVAGPAEDKLGLRGSTTVPLAIDVVVPASALLGEVGDGMKIALSALDGGRIGIASQALGLGEAALAAARDYAKQRTQFGQPIADFQAIQFQLAQAATELSAARLLALRAAWCKEQRQRFSPEAAMAKLFATEAAWRATDMALQVHGGYGYTKDFPVERYLRDVRVSRIYEGTSEVQRLVIARALLQDGERFYNLNQRQSV